MDELISLLLRALSDEWQAALQYQIHASQLRGLYRDPIADHLKEHADDEIGHAERLTIHLYSRGVDPIVQMPQVDLSTDVVEMLSADLQDEVDAIDLYTQIVAMCEGDEGLTDTRMLIEDILVDEVEHQDDAAALLRGKVGSREEAIGAGARMAAAEALIRTAEVYDDRDMVEEADDATRVAEGLLSR